eukprot:m51a1_g4990 hypothetical protein (163) ;mRNA; f:101189-101677
MAKWGAVVVSATTGEPIAEDQLAGCVLGNARHVNLYGMQGSAEARARDFPRVDIKLSPLQSAEGPSHAVREVASLNLMVLVNTRIVVRATAESVATAEGLRILKNVGVELSTEAGMNVQVRVTLEATGFEDRRACAYFTIVATKHGKIWGADQKTAVLRLQA